MKPLADSLANRPTVQTPFRAERDEYVQLFTDRLNAARTGTKWKPLTCRAIAVKVSHLSVSDLHAFYKQCSQAKSFSAYFFWALKPAPLKHDATATICQHS